MAEQEVIFDLYDVVLTWRDGVERRSPYPLGSDAAKKWAMAQENERSGELMDAGFDIPGTIPEIEYRPSSQMRLIE